MPRARSKGRSRPTPPVDPTIEPVAFVEQVLATLPKDHPSFTSPDLINCCVCLSQLNPNNNHKHSDFFRLTCCGNGIHKECANAIDRQSQTWCDNCDMYHRTNGPPKCPLCRAVLIPSQGAYVEEEFEGACEEEEDNRLWRWATKGSAWATYMVAKKLTPASAWLKDEYLKEAANLGYAPAQYHLAKQCHKSELYAEECSYLTLAADQGHLLSIAQLAQRYYSGQGVAQNYNTTGALLLVAAQHKKAMGSQAAHVLGMLGHMFSKRLFDRARRYSAEESSKLAAGFWTMAIGVKSNGRYHALALAALGNLYYNGIGVEKDDTSAFALWLRAAADPSSAHQNLRMVARCYERGRGVEKSWKHAVKWHKKAAAKGNVDSQFDLGNMSDGGLSILPPRGIELNFETAEHYYEMAAKQDHALAAYCLSVLRQDDGDARGARWWSKSAVNMARTKSTTQVVQCRRTNCTTSALVQWLRWTGCCFCVAYSSFFLDCDASSCNPVANGAFASCYLPVLLLFIYFCNIRLDNRELVERGYLFCAGQGFHVWLKYYDSSSPVWLAKIVQRELVSGVLFVVYLALWLHLCSTLIRLENERLLQELKKQREASYYED